MMLTKEEKQHKLFPVFMLMISLMQNDPAKDSQHSQIWNSWNCTAKEAIWLIEILPWSFHIYITTAWHEWKPCWFLKWNNTNKLNTWLTILNGTLRWSSNAVLNFIYLERHLYLYIWLLCTSFSIYAHWGAHLSLLQPHLPEFLHIGNNCALRKWSFKTNQWVQDKYFSLQFNLLWELAKQISERMKTSSLKFGIITVLLEFLVSFKIMISIISLPLLTESFSTSTPQTSSCLFRNTEYR